MPPRWMIRTTPRPCPARETLARCRHARSKWHGALPCADQASLVVGCVIVLVAHLDEVVADGIERVVLIAVALLGGRQFVQEGVGDPRAHRDSTPVVRRHEGRVGGMVAME